MFYVVKRNKNPKSRKLAIYKDKKIFTYAMPFWGWYSFSSKLDNESNKQCRKLVIENLYWLLGNNCDMDVWRDSIERWDKGIIFNVPIDKTPTSMFFDGEKEIALNSFYN